MTENRSRATANRSRVLDWLLDLARFVATVPGVVVEFVLRHTQPQHTPLFTE